MVKVRPPDSARKLDSGADKIKRATTIFVHAWNQQKASNCETRKIGAAGIIEGRVSQAQLFYVPAVRQTVDVNKDKSEENVEASEAEVHRFSE